MILVLVTVLLVLFVIFQYYSIQAMQDELKFHLSNRIDEFLHSVHYKSMSHLNRTHMSSDAQKLSQLESLITRLERLAEHNVKDD